MFGLTKCPPPRSDSRKKKQHDRRIGDSKKKSCKKDRDMKRRIEKKQREQKRNNERRTLALKRAQSEIAVDLYSINYENNAPDYCGKNCGWECGCVYDQCDDTNDTDDEYSFSVGCMCNDSNMLCTCGAVSDMGCSVYPPSWPDVGCESSGSEESDSNDANSENGM